MSKSQAQASIIVLAVPGTLRVRILFKSTIPQKNINAW
jgi:hypothetical protein